MPYTVDEEKIQGKISGQPMLSMELHNPPTRQILHADFPRIVYKHPREAFRTIEHRNARHEVVQEEIVAAEHLTLRVENKADLEKALKAGWVKEPYIPEAPPDPNAGLYDAEAEGKSS